MNTLVIEEENACGNDPESPSKAKGSDDVWLGGCHSVAEKIGLILCQEKPALQSCHGPQKKESIAE